MRWSVSNTSVAQTPTANLRCRGPSLTLPVRARSRTRAPRAQLSWLGVLLRSISCAVLENLVLCIVKFCCCFCCRFMFMCYCFISHGIGQLQHGAMMISLGSCTLSGNLRPTFAKDHISTRAAHLQAMRNDPANRSHHTPD